ncbi:MAG: RNA polymerase subunit sigma-54 [Pirellulaceae bacterium]|nr:MAG: RNA polymerase subunit sigma-54 [Pirellulaceae bacterium]
MQVNLSVRHGELSDATQQVVAEKVERLRRFFDRINAIGVTVDLANDSHPEVELNVSVEHLPDVVAKAAGGNVLAALDAALHKAEQQLRKLKERLIDGHRGGGHKAHPGTGPVA